VIQPDDTLLLFDFTDPAAVNDWAAIDDRVMGGISRSGMRHDPAGHAVFEGTVSLERNGGFASVRSSPSTRGKPHATAGLRIDVRSNNKQFNLSFLTVDPVCWLDLLQWRRSTGRTLTHGLDCMLRANAVGAVSPVENRLAYCWRSPPTRSYPCH